MDIFIVLFGMLGRFFAKLMRCHPIDTVVTAATAHLVPPYTKERVESLHIPPYIVRSKGKTHM